MCRTDLTFKKTLTLLHQVKNEVSEVNKVADFLARGFRVLIFSFGEFVVYFLVFHFGN